MWQPRSHCLGALVRLQDNGLRVCANCPCPYLLYLMLDQLPLTLYAPTALTVQAVAAAAPRAGVVWRPPALTNLLVDTKHVLQESLATMTTTQKRLI